MTMLAYERSVDLRTVTLNNFISITFSNNIAAIATDALCGKFTVHWAQDIVDSVESVFNTMSLDQNQRNEVWNYLTNLPSN